MKLLYRFMLYMYQVQIHYHVCFSASNILLQKKKRYGSSGLQYLLQPENIGLNFFDHRVEKSI